MSIWCRYDVYMMSTWCLHDVYMMPIWCLYDVYMIAIWYLYDVYDVYMMQPRGQNHQNHAEKQSKFKLDKAKSSKPCRKTKQIQAWHCKIIKIMQKNKANSRFTLQNQQNHAEKQSICGYVVMSSGRIRDHAKRHPQLIGRGFALFFKEFIVFLIQLWRSPK